MDSEDDDNNYNSGDEYAYDDCSEPDGFHDDDGMEDMKTGEVRRQLSKEGSERAVVLSGFGKVYFRYILLLSCYPSYLLNNQPTIS